MNLFILSSIFLQMNTVLVSSLDISCPVTIPTVSYVSKCPSNETEWKSAAQQKQCDELAKLQNCTEPEKFVYHCVLNKDGTKYVEVCAKVWFMSGYCARFSIADERIINEPGQDCTKFSTPCPRRFRSNKSFEYQECYVNPQQSMKTIRKEKTIEETSSSHSALVTFLCIFVIIAVLLGVILFFSNKKKIHDWWSIRRERAGNFNDTPHHTNEEEGLVNDKKIMEEGPSDVTERKEEEAEESTHNEENQVPFEDSTNQIGDFTAAADVDDEKMSFRTLSGFEGQCSVKNVTTISDLRDNLSKELSQKRENIWVVQEERGIIYNDDTEFKELKKHQSQIEVMISNDRRAVCLAYRSTEAETDVIANNFGASQKCKMSCNHFTEPESLFNYIRSNIKKGNVTVTCPKCRSTWEMEELLIKSNMSPDEQLFFWNAMSINKQAKKKFNIS